MSFADVGSTGGGGRRGGRAPPRGGGADVELQQRITSNLQRMNYLLTEMKKCNGRLGKKTDNADNRRTLAEAQEESTQIRQDTMRLIKDFRSSGATQAQQDKLVRDFQSVMKKVVDATKETETLMRKHPEPVGSGGAGGSGRKSGFGASLGGGDSASQSLMDDDWQQQQQQARLMNNQEQIARREEDLQQIESTVADVAEIMQDLAVIVHSHDGLIDNIETAVENTEQKTREAGSELTKAANYQKGARKWTCCLFLILIVIVAIIVIYVVVKNHDN